MFRRSSPFLAARSRRDDHIRQLRDDCCDLFRISVSAYPTTIFLVGAGIIAVLDVLVIFPFKLWRANKAEIARLQGNISEDRERLWTLRESGVDLRNEGKNSRLPDQWRPKFDEWHTAALAQAKLVSRDLGHALSPIDKIDEKNQEKVVAWKDSRHQKKVSIMSEMLDRIYQHLWSTR